MLQAAIRLHGGRVGQMDPVVGVHQLIDEPVPVGSRLHYHARDLGVIRSQLLQNGRSMIGSVWVIPHLVLLIEDHDHTVVGM